MKVFSERNMRLMRMFLEEYANNEKWQQLVAKYFNDTIFYEFYLIWSTVPTELSLSLLCADKDNSVVEMTIENYAKNV